MTDVNELRTAYHNHDSALLPQLLICRLIHEQPRQWTARTLAEGMEVSRETVKRMIADLRNMGADLEAIGRKGYELRNGERVMPRLNRWIELEQSRDLTGCHGG